MDAEKVIDFISIVDKIDDAVIAFDNNLHYTFANKKALKLINKKAEEVLGKHVEEVIPGIKDTRGGKEFYKVAKTGKTNIWEYYSEQTHQWLRGHGYKTPTGIVVFYTDVSERHLLEDSLGEQAKLLDLSFDAIQMQDEHNRIFYWNKGAEQVYGWKAQEVIGKIGYKVFGTQFPGGYDKFFRQLRKNKHWIGSLHHKTKDNREIIVRSSWSLVETDGKVHILEINRDITEQEAAKQQLTLNEKKFKSMIEKSADVISITDKNLKIMYVSPSIKKVLNYTPEEFMKKPAIQIIHPGDWGKSVKLYGKLLLNPGGSLTDVIRVKDKSGNWHWIESTATNFMNNPFIQGVVSNFRDITDARMAEQKIEESEKRFRSLIENSSDVIMITNAKGKITYISPSIEKILGYAPEEIINSSKKGFFHPDDVERTMGNLKKLLTGEISHSRGQYRVRTKSGEWRWIDVKAKSLLADPAIQGIVSNFRDITDEKIAEQKLEESEKRFRSLIENSTDVILVTNANDEITYVSPSITKQFGYTPQEVLGTNPMKYVHPEDKEKEMNNARKLLSGKVNHTSGQYRVRAKNGEWRWIHTEATNLLDDPTVQGFVSNFRDITAEKQYQEEIENRNKKITEILENFSYAYYGIDKNWRYTYVNKAGEQFAGKKREDMLGKTVDEVFPKAKDLISDEVSKRVMETRVAEDYDAYFSPFKKWFHNYVYPTSEGIAIYATDITEKKNIEQEIENTKLELDAILKNIPNGVMVQDDQGNLFYVNDAAAKITGYSSTEEMLKAPKFDYIYKFDLRDEYGKKFAIENLPGRKALQDGSSSHVTVKIIDKETGESRWTTLTATVIHGHLGKPLVVNVIEDVTEFKEADVRKNDFISMASHELKTPLTSLKVYMHLLTEKQKLEEEKKSEYITKASDQVEKLQSLVSEMLDQSTIQQGKLSLHLQEIYFDYFVKEYISTFQQTTDGFKIQLKGQTNSIVTIDKYRVEQVLANLLSNAVKYSKDRKEILVNIKKQADSVSLSVKDFGMGIPPSELENIFKPYYRVIGKKENTFPGMGMGLYISKDIIEKHGGEIIVESTIGKGTTFTITIPISN